MLDDLDLLEAVLAPAIADPVGQDAIARRAGDVRIGGQERVSVACFRRRGQREESIFEAAFRGGGSRSETKDHRRGSLAKDACRASETEDTKGTKDTEERNSPKHRPLASVSPVTFVLLVPQRAHDLARCQHPRSSVESSAGVRAGSAEVQLCDRCAVPRPAEQRAGDEPL